MQHQEKTVQLLAFEIKGYVATCEVKMFDIVGQLHVCNHSVWVIGSYITCQNPLSRTVNTDRWVSNC